MLFKTCLYLDVHLGVWPALDRPLPPWRVSAAREARTSHGGKFCPFVFPLAAGSPVMSGYYGVRRSFLSDSDFHNTKQFAGDMCTSGPAAKPFACEAPAGQSHPGLLDPYFPEPYGDHRPPGLTPSTGSLFSASPLPPLLPPPFPGDPTTHFVLVSMQLCHGCG